jgi:hypothetical protein
MRRRDKQLPDRHSDLDAAGTCVTTPGSAILFPALTVPTADLPNHASGHHPLR